MRYKLILSLSAIILTIEAHSCETHTQSLFDPFALKGDSHFALTTDLLFWHSSQDGLEFVFKNKNGTTLNTGDLKEPDFGWNIGFRAGLDYKLAHDQWDLNTCYTYFHADASKRESAPQGGALFPLWQEPTGGFATEAKAKWMCDLNRADLELGRSCIVSQWLSIRPFIGISGGVINQKYHLVYEGGTAVSTNDQDNVKMSNDFWGVGLRFGFNSLWGLGKGFSLWANGAGTFLSGRFHIDQKEHLKINDTTLLKINDSESSIVPIVEMSLGLQWDYTWREGRYHFGTKLGWEFQDYFNQNRFIRFLSATNPGSFSQNNDDLSFMGITLGFRFDF